MSAVLATPTQAQVDQMSNELFPSLVMATDAGDYAEVGIAGLRAGLYGLMFSCDPCRVGPIHWTGLVRHVRDVETCVPRRDAAAGDPADEPVTSLHHTTDFEVLSR